MLEFWLNTSSKPAYSASALALGRCWARSVVAERQTKTNLSCESALSWSKKERNYERDGEEIALFGIIQNLQTKVINLRSDTFGNPIFQTVLQN